MSRLKKKDYSKLTKEELIHELENVLNGKKYGLVWEDKPEDVAEMCKNNFPILEPVNEKDIRNDETGPTNIMIEGDNYHALSVLNYTHAGKIDVIYIDPPYNTGASDWKYNNDYVDENDTYRHSKWLNMMWNRLRLVKALLKENGVVIITIDDHELFGLLGLAEALGAKILGNVSICIKPEGRRQSKYFMEAHEYAVFMTWGNPKMRGLNVDFGLDFPENDSISKFRWEGLMRRDSPREDRGSQFWYPFFVSENGEISTIKKNGHKEVWPINTKGIERVWLWDKDRATDHLDELKAVIRKDKITVYYKRRELGRVKPTTFWYGSKYNANAYGTRAIQTILPDDSFDYPKSVYSVLDCIDLFLPKNGTVLDFFAGSGTTGHATMLLNKQGGNRQFILCTNNENGIAEKICYPRVKKVIAGYKNGKTMTAPLPHNLKYYRTNFVHKNDQEKTTDDDRIKLALHTGEMIALRENTLKEKTDETDHYQIFTDGKQHCAIYFREDMRKLPELTKKIAKLEKVALYIFSWTKGQYQDDFAEFPNITVNDIPEPIIEVYKQINAEL